jgi:alanyl-tRNA synthetase
MTSRAAAEPYTLEFSATVESIDGTHVVLDATHFYAEGGGQPADRGTIEGVDVTDVQHRDGRVVHELEEPPAFEVGDAVGAAGDPEFRRYCMRAHTASHVLYGAGRRLLDDLRYGGFDISSAKVRVDLATPTEVDDEAIVELERLTNLAVWESRDVTWEELPREAALGRDDVAFNETTEEGLSGDAVRIVTVEGWDVAACGGTHVRNTREVGPVTVLGRSNPGEGLTRVEFAVGPEAIERRATERSRAMDAAAALETGVDELPDAVSRLQDERAALGDELESLRATVVDDRIAALRESTVRKNGQAWLAGAVPALDANGLAERSRQVVDGDDGVDVAALVDEDGGYLAVATTDDGGVDAGAVVEAVTEAFGGGGGGSPTVAQGGGLGADPDDVVAFLREEA